jgi:hypothetical protein
MTDPVSDRAIDTVARRMTAREPSAGFSARVVARLDEGRVRRLPWTWIALPVGAAALVILAIASLPMMRGPQPPAPERPTVAQGGGPALPGVQPAPLTPAPTVAMVAQTRPRATARRDAGIVVEPAHGGVVIEALQHHAPIRVAPVQPPAIPLGDVSVAPLADLKPIEMEPLPASGGRE